MTKIENQEPKGVDEVDGVGPNEPGSSPVKRLIYTINDVPPWYLSLILGFQQYLLMFGGTVATPYIISKHLCIRDDDPARAYLISTAFFVAGIATLLQTIFGVRLPIIQGAGSAFLVAALSILKLPQWECPSKGVLDVMSEEERTEEWQKRMREVQGAIIAASVVEALMGLTGIIGQIVRWITPLTIVPTITLIGLSLFRLAGREAGSSWPFAALTIILLVLFSQYLAEVGVPYRKKKIYVFKLFSVLLTILIVWVLCLILTATNVLPPTHSARTDNRTIIIHTSPWFRFPYPFQWGMPTFTTSAIVGLLAAIIASSVDTIGDYFACARLCEAPAPPTHAINRGIFLEGISCILSGMWGFGGGLSSYSLNIGAIGVTRVGSRTVAVAAGFLMIALSLLTKFGALFVTIPPSIMGGVFCVTFGMIVAVGLSTLQFVDLNSTRNLFVLGFSIFMGLVLPTWITEHPDAIQTGFKELDNIITVALSIEMFVGGFFGFLLDNTVPGTLEERGIRRWLSEMKLDKHDIDGGGARLLSKCYDLPYGITGFLIRTKISRFLPISPGFDQLPGDRVVETARRDETNSLKSPA